MSQHPLTLAVRATATRAPPLALVFAALVIAHEVAAYDRIAALIQGPPR